MALIYAGGQWRNVPDRNNAQGSSPAAVAAAISQPARPVLNNAQGSSPAAVAAMIQNYVPPAPTQAPVDDKKPDQQQNQQQANPGMSAADVQAAIDRALAAEREAANRQREAEKRQRDQEAVAFLGDILTQYGMGDLKDSINNLVQEWGNNTSVIANNLRQTDSYKTRFRGLTSLQKKGITDVRNEADYIRLETEYRQAFREAGLQSYLGGAGSPTERDAIAQLVGDYTVSVTEVKNRIADAQRVVNETAPEVRDALQRYYNVSAADLVAYTLDPTRTQDQINRKANAAIFGGLAQARGLDADVNTAESIAALSGANDLSTQNAAIQLGTARQVRDATKRLANLEATDLSDSEILQSEFSIDPEAQRKVKGLQSRERARFGGTSAAGRDTLTRTASI